MTLKCPTIIYNPWRWEHSVAKKHWDPISSWCNFMSHSNNFLGYTIAKAS